jgi:hypothetical protein
MFRKLRKLLIIPFVVGTLMTPALVPVIAHATDTNLQKTIVGQECKGSDLNLDTNGLATGTGCTGDSTGLNSLLTNIINIFSVLVGAIAVIMIIIGGFRYVISSGNDQAVSGAKNTIIFALVGLVIVALAQFLVHFVIGNI